jgi:hypothetical protein
MFNAVPIRAIGNNTRRRMWWPRLHETDDAKLLLKMCHGLALKEAVDVVYLQLQISELLLHLNTACLSLHAGHLERD